MTRDGAPLANARLRPRSLRFPIPIRAIRLHDPQTGTAGRCRWRGKQAHIPQHGHNRLSELIPRPDRVDIGLHEMYRQSRRQFAFEAARLVGPLAAIARTVLRWPTLKGTAEPRSAMAAFEPAALRTFCHRFRHVINLVTISAPCNRPTDPSEGGISVLGPWPCDP